MRIQLLALVIQLMIQINLKSQDTLDIDIDPTQEPLFLKNYESLQLNKEDISRMWLIGLADLGVEQRLFHKFSIKGSINTFLLVPTSIKMTLRQTLILTLEELMALLIFILFHRVSQVKNKSLRTISWGRIWNLLCRSVSKC